MNDTEHFRALRKVVSNARRMAKCPSNFHQLILLRDRLQAALDEYDGTTKHKVTASPVYGPPFPLKGQPVAPSIPPGFRVP